MHLRLLEPPFGPERSTEVVMGARLVGVEVDRALEMLGGLLSGRARRGWTRDRFAPRASGAGLHRPAKNLGRFLVAPLGRDDPSERLEHGGLWGQAWAARRA